MEIVRGIKSNTQRSRDRNKSSISEITALVAKITASCLEFLVFIMIQIITDAHILLTDCSRDLRRAALGQHDTTMGRFYNAVRGAYRDTKTALVYHCGCAAPSDVYCSQ